MFINEYRQGTLTEAFRLCQQSDNIMIKRGEDMLQRLRYSRLYANILLNYLSERNTNINYRLRAALELQDIIDEWFTNEEDEDIDEFEKLITNLIEIYIKSEWQISKILRDIILMFEITEEVIRYITSWDTGSHQVTFRIMKLYSRMLKTQQHNLVEKIEILAKHVLARLENGLQPKPGDLAIQSDLTYQYVKILSLYIKFSSQIMQEQFLAERLYEAFDLVLKLPIDLINDKKMFKMKGKAFSCISSFSHHNTNVWKTAIDFFRYIAQMRRRNPQLSKYCLKYYSSFIQRTRNIDNLASKQKQEVLTEILQSALDMCYQPNTMYKLFIEDPTFFIQQYFEYIDEEDTELYTCRRIFREFLRNHATKWYRTFELLRRQGMSPDFLCFLCQSSMFFQFRNSGQYHLPSQTIQNLSTQIIKQNLQNLKIQNLFNPIDLEQNQIVKIVCSLRFFCYFKNDIPLQNLKSVAIFCSQLMLRSKEIQFLCCYILNEILQTTNLAHLQCSGNQQYPWVFSERNHYDPKFLYEILENSSKNAEQMTLKDLEFIFSAVQIITIRQERLDRGFQKPLKILSLAILKKFQKGGKPQLIEKLSDVPYNYVLDYQYEREFTEPLLNIIKNKIINPKLADIYIDYLNKASDDPKQLAEMYAELSSEDFWVRNMDCGQVYAHTLIALTKKMEHTTADMSRALKIANDTVDYLCKQKKYKQAGILGLQIVCQAKQKGLSEQINNLYAIALIHIRNSFDIAEFLSVMMAVYPHYLETVRQTCLNSICQAYQRNRTQKQCHFDEILDIIFVNYQMYFQRSSEQSWKKWGFLFSQIFKTKNLLQAQKKSATELFCTFYRKYKPNIGRILLQRYQIILTSWMFEFNMVIDL